LHRLCGFSSTGCCRRRLSSRPRPLFELVLSSRVLPSHTYPAVATAESSHGLSFPTALERVRGPLAAGLSLPATFRLQGLATLLTVYSLEPRAGFVSHRQRSWDSPFGGFSSRLVSRRFHRKRTHIPLAQRLTPPPKRRTGPTSFGSWVHSSRECLAVARCFKPKIRWCLPWVLPL
jgi:hypothetical protein